MSKVTKTARNGGGYKLAALLALVSAFACQGALSVQFKSAMEVEIDGEVRSFANGAVWSDPEKRIYKMRPVLPEGGRTFGIEGNGTTVMHYFPQYGEGNWVRVSLSGDEQVTLTGYKVSNIYYADVVGPKKTLQAACDGATAGGQTVGYPLVLVAPGIYSEGGATTYSSGTSYPCNRRLYVAKSIGFIATEGPDRTCIVGAPDPSTADGKGENAVGGVKIVTQGRAFLQGFTITGCYSPASQPDRNQWGTAFNCGGRSTGYVIDCVISNNVAVKYAVSSYGVVMRTRILENTVYQFLSEYSGCVSCIFAANRITIGNTTDNSNALMQYGALRFCTVDLTNDGNTSGRKRVQASTKLYGTLVYGLTDTSTIDANWYDSLATDTPQFADVASRDYRLGMTSPAMDAVLYASSSLDERAQKFRTADVDGRMPVLHDGKMPCGACWRNEPEDRYVDCVNGDDANDGTSAAQAKKTIRAAMAESVGGDTIYVAPGVYGEQEGTQPWIGSTSANTSGTKARVLVRSGVTLESTEGADKTFIVGAASPEPSVAEGWQAGIGPYAVRCVAAEDDSTLRGFTLTGGYTHSEEATTAANKYGSAFYSRNARSATIEDCIVSNNTACFYTIYQAVVRGCRVVGNAAAAAGVNTSSGAAGCMCAWYNSVIAHNKGNYTLLQPKVVENCTLGDGNVWTSSGGSSQVLSWWDSNSHSIVNTAWLYGRLFIHSGGSLCCTNCLVLNTIDFDRSFSHNTIFTNAAAMQVDAEFRPVLGSFAGIDAGDASVSAAEIGDTDIYGTPRILNGAIDVGAVEYDWRPKFGSEIGRRFTVTYASPTVTTNATGGLKLDGATGALGDRALPVCIAGTANEAGRYEFRFELAGGSAAAYVGDVLAGEASGAGSHSIWLNVPDAAAEIRFVFTPDQENPGAAVLKRFANGRGFIITFQ